MSSLVAMSSCKLSEFLILLRRLLWGSMAAIFSGSCIAGSGVVCRLVDVKMQFDGLDLLRHHDVHGRGYVAATCENFSEQMQHVLLQVYDDNTRLPELSAEPSKAEKLVVSLFVDEAQQIPVANHPGNAGILRQELSLRSKAVSRIEFPFFVRLHTVGMLAAGVYEKESGFHLRYSLITNGN